MKEYVDVNLNNFFKVNDSMLDGVNLFRKEEVLAAIESGSANTLAVEAAQVLMNPPRGAHNQIKKLQNLVFRLTQVKLWDEILINRMLSELNRLSDGYAERSRKRWTQEEDEMLIEMAARDEVNVLDLTRTFGRTAGAITTRISYLVGIQKMSTRVAGRFIGWLDGEQVEGEIDGTLSKEV